jgi:hypothetical protein
MMRLETRHMWVDRVDDTTVVLTYKDNQALRFVVGPDSYLVLGLNTAPHRKRDKPGWLTELLEGFGDG